MLPKVKGVGGIRRIDAIPKLVKLDWLGFSA
jgi:hypothetical protein